jgi:hypothetical protein
VKEHVSGDKVSRWYEILTLAFASYRPTMSKRYSIDRDNRPAFSPGSPKMLYKVIERVKKHA